jgi:hypothetical protein
MKRTAIVLFSLLSIYGIAQARDTQNSDGINFYAPQYPGMLTLATTTSESALPLVCKSTSNSIVNCSFNTSNNTTYSTSVYGQVNFQTVDKSGYCSYQLTAFAQGVGSSGKWTIQMSGFKSKNMSCDTAINGAYDVEYPAK